MLKLPVEPLTTTHSAASTEVSLQIGLNRPSLIIAFSTRRAWEAWLSENQRRIMALGTVAD